MPRTAAVLLLSLLTSISSRAQTPAARAKTNSIPLAIGETFSLPSAVLHENRRINVYVPTGIADSMRLPVLYMPDGGVREDFLHIAGLVQVLVGNGGMRPFILVGIENTERRRDLTGPTDNAEDRKIAPRVGGSAAFRTFIRTELMPEVTARYRTTDERVIMGESLAGLFVVETLLLEPELFDTYIAFDPSLWWNDERLVTTLDARSTSRPTSRKMLVLAASSDAATLTQRLALKLQLGVIPRIECEYIPMLDETHATIYHPAALRALRTLFKPPPMK